MKRIVVALGGNALGNTPMEQIERVKHAVIPIAELIAQGHQVILAHGNGPQVGMINLAFETISLSDKIHPLMPFPECGAMSQGYIGYHLQNALQTELRHRKIDKKVATIITQVEVDKDDEAFQHPTKPIGSFYLKETADELEKTRGYVMKEDANRGYRRVIASPKPLKIVEQEIIETLIAANHIVITVGGGGIPVIKEQDEYVGVPAVIDKDFASATLATSMDADLLIILTAVDRVKLHFGKQNEVSLGTVTVSEMEQYIQEGHFLKGSMLPKVEAACTFVKGHNNREAIIASLEEAPLALSGKTGTKIIA